MQATERTAQQLLHSSDQYVIPVFQRYYTWAKKDWLRLWEDLILLLEPGEEQRRHFLGSLVCVPDNPSPGAITPYQVIDGQQRLTTISILLCVLRDLAHERDEAELASEIEETYLIHKFKKDRERFKLYPRQRDRQAYLDLVLKGGVAEDSQIGKAYTFFRKKVAGEAAIKEEGGLRAFFNAVATRVELVAITLKDESPYKIFKSLNSTGVPLEESDLIRNHVFMTLPVDEQDTFDDNQWRPLEAHFEEYGKLDAKLFSWFFRDVLLRKGHYIRVNATFEEFQRTYPASTLVPEVLVAELRQNACIYDYLGKRRPHPDREIETALAMVRALDATTANPLLLNLLAAHQKGRLTHQALVCCLRMVSGFVLRRYVCGESSRGYANWFCSINKELGDNPLEALLIFFLEKGWPQDTRFKESLKTFAFKDKDYRRALLEGLELDLQHATEPVPLTQCSVEHVMPQTIKGDTDGRLWQAALGDSWQEAHEAWLHTIGNLTLVGNDYNQSMSNRSFDEKKKVLAQSKVYLNGYFQDPALSVWNIEAISTRSDRLAERASALWFGPKQATVTMGI